MKRGKVFHKRHGIEATLFRKNICILITSKNTQKNSKYFLYFTQIIVSMNVTWLKFRNDWMVYCSQGLKWSSSKIRNNLSLISKLNKYSYHRSSIKDCFLAAIDISFLYPNINHNEWVEACMKAFAKRSEKCIQSKSLCKLVRGK